MPEISSFEREECDRRPDLEAVTAALHEGEHVPSVVQSAPGGSSDPFAFDRIHDLKGQEMYW